MDDQSSARSFVRRTQKRAIIAGAGIGIALLLVWSKQAGLGFMSGVALSVVNFQLMAVDAFEMTGKAPKKARGFIIGRFALRFAILFGFLAVIATQTDFNILAAFAGLFFVQVVLFAGQVRDALRERVKD